MGRKTNIEKEEVHKFNMANLTPPQFDEGIKIIDKQIKLFNKIEDKRIVLNKEGSEDLNNKLGFYGMKFTTRTTVSAVLKNLNDHKKRLEQEKQYSHNLGRLAEMKKGQTKAGKTESIEV